MSQSPGRETLRESVASASPDIHIFQGEEAASKKQSSPRPDSPFC